MFGEDQREICHVSVITRATAPDFAQKSVPLKCKSEEICLTEDIGKRCVDQFGKDEDVHFVVLKGSDGQKAEKIAETNANAMFDCWSMMGEGKLDLFGELSTEFGIGKVKSSCVICSRVAVDKSVDSKVIVEKDSTDKGTGGVDINDYMKKNQVPGSPYTYLQTFTDRGVSSYATVKQESLTNVKEDPVKLSGVSNGEMAFVFMQIKSKTIEGTLKSQFAAALTIGAGTFMSPVGNLVKKAIFTPYGMVATGVAAGAVAGFGAYNAYQGQLAASGYCGKFTSTDQASAGCSIVQGIDYNVKDVNALCGTIEGEV